MTDKKALYVRRNKIEEMYKSGFQIIDICRYFEVPIRSVKKSLKALNIPYEKKIEKYKGSINKELEKRDRFISDACEEEKEAEFGFWRIPQQYSIGKQIDEKEKKCLRIGLQNELRIIGIVPSEICIYMGYDSLKQVKAHSPWVNSFLKEQISKAKQLQETGWTNENIIEFCGISIRNIAKAEEKINAKIRENSTVRNYDSIKERAEIAYNLYSGKVDGREWSYQEISEKKGWSRQSVMRYVREYRIEHKLNEDRRKSIGNKGRSKRDMEGVAIALREKYLERNGEEFIFKEYDDNGKRRRYTIAKAAAELGVTEVTIVKYKKKLEKGINIQ